MGESGEERKGMRGGSIALQRVRSLWDANRGDLGAFLNVNVGVPCLVYVVPGSGGEVADF